MATSMETEVTAEMPRARTLSVERRDDGVALLTFDVPGQPHNTLSPAMLAEFEQRITEVLADDAVVAVVLCSGKPEGFIAGADLKVLEAMSTEAEAAELSRRGNELLSRLALAKKPVVAAVHGPALGGGLEVVLACHYILASNDPATVLALPEVMLGLLPAGGGTQRLPRRVGLVAALPMLLTGKRIRAKKALRMGLVDALTTPGGIAETAAHAAALLAAGKLKRRKRKKSWLDRLAATPWGRGTVLRKARAEVQAKTRGLYPAPLAILDCVEDGLRSGVEAGFRREAELFGKLVVSPEAASLVRMFHWNTELKKEAQAGVAARPVRRVAVLGAGFMGAGVASVSVGRWPVVLRDLSEDVLSSAARLVHDGLHKQLRSGSISAVERDRRWSRLYPTTDVAALRGCDLVIEAVFENLDLKRKVLAEAEDLIAPDAVFATNTSALPIADIARDAKHPERVLGMHYFSPVPKMPLLELVAAERTAPWAIETARAAGIAQGKTVIVVGDGPGFYTSRVLAPFLNEAILMLAEGARIEDIDRALLDFGFPVGPVALIDEVGIDVGAHVTQDLAEFFAARDAAPSDVLPRLFAAGYHGRKNNKGFYRYPAKGKIKTVNEDVYAFFGGAGARRDFAREDIVDRMVLLMVNEAQRCLAEGVLRSERDGDVGAVFGLGFPPFLGGPFRYAAARGAPAVQDRLQDLATVHGPRFAPSATVTARS